ncbi:diguanylate cyclase [Vibrio sp. CAIM 722]|uniref:diguanylate cyclase n=1 Tax=Vibrio eleionomae TaxID=2653505 RepID=A0A7X4LK92_9VIBR|nr:GGDEF domain-containing protein [Vibrio eleionomae]MZI93523.1 diguanylate cyclase [Vibrio eleionomae]
MQYSSTTESPTKLAVQLKRSSDCLLRVPNLPERIKRDLHNLLSFSSTHQSSDTEKACQLLNLYDITIKILTSNRESTIQEIVGYETSSEQLKSLNKELQHVITELDFEGEYGDLLVDIRAKLLLGVSASALLELTLQVLQLVVLGTESERKSSERFLDQTNESLQKLRHGTEQVAQQSQSDLIHRQALKKSLKSVVHRSQQSLVNDKDFSSLQTRMTPLISELASLTDQLEQAQRREQLLVEQIQYSQRQIEALSDSTQEYRRRLADQAQRLLMDPLTNTLNRNAFNDQLEIEYRRWIRNQHSLRIALIDIDNFKQVNEHFGYSAGDKALKIITRTINKELKQNDVLARFGGEEFSLILPNHSDKEALVLIQKIQRNIALLPFKFRDRSLQITVSVACSAFQDADTPDILLDQLGKSLTEIKNFGSNQLAWI